MGGWNFPSHATSLGVPVRSRWRSCGRMGSFSGRVESLSGTDAGSGAAADGRSPLALFSGELGGTTGSSWARARAPACFSWAAAKGGIAARPHRRTPSRTRPGTARPVAVELRYEYITAPDCWFRGTELAEDPGYDGASSAAIRVSYGSRGSEVTIFHSGSVVGGPAGGVLGIGAIGALHEGSARESRSRSHGTDLPMRSGRRAPRIPGVLLPASPAPWHLVCNAEPARPAWGRDPGIAEEPERSPQGGATGRLRGEGSGLRRLLGAPPARPGAAWCPLAGAHC
jgi:hypothetical protein